MKRVFKITIFSALVTAVVIAGELSGRDILDKAIKRYRGDDSIMKVLITKTKINNPSSKKQFEITTYNKIRPEVVKALVAVKRAGRKGVKPMLFLVWDWQDTKKKDQVWLYLPSIGKYNKLSADEAEKRAQSFGLSIEEMKTRDLDDATHKNEGLVDFKGTQCYKVVSVPKNPKKEGMSKITTFIRPNSWTLAQAELTGLDGKPARKFRVTKIEKIDGIWTEMAGKGENYEKGYSVTFEVKHMEYNKKLPSKYFSFTAPPNEVLEGN